MDRCSDAGFCAGLLLQYKDRHRKNQGYPRDPRADTNVQPDKPQLNKFRTSITTWRCTTVLGYSNNRIMRRYVKSGRTSTAGQSFRFDLGTCAQWL